MFSIPALFSPPRLLSVQDFAVSTVPVCGGARLKNICSMGGPDTIIISNCDGAKKTLRVCVCVSVWKWIHLSHAYVSVATNCSSFNHNDWNIHMQECTSKKKTVSSHTIDLKWITLFSTSYNAYNTSIAFSVVLYLVQCSTSPAALNLADVLTWNTSVWTQAISHH